MNAEAHIVRSMAQAILEHDFDLLSHGGLVLALRSQGYRQPEIDKHVDEARQLAVSMRSEHPVIVRGRAE